MPAASNLEIDYAGQEQELEQEDNSVNNNANVVVPVLTPQGTRSIVQLPEHILQIPGFLIAYLFAVCQNLFRITVLSGRALNQVTQNAIAENTKTNDTLKKMDQETHKMLDSLTKVGESQMNVANDLKQLQEKIAKIKARRKRWEEGNFGGGENDDQATTATQTPAERMKVEDDTQPNKD